MKDAGFCFGVGPDDTLFQYTTVRLVPICRRNLNHH